MINAVEEDESEKQHLQWNTGCQGHDDHRGDKMRQYDSNFHHLANHLQTLHRMPEDVCIYSRPITLGTIRPGDFLSRKEV